MSKPCADPLASENVVGASTQPALRGLSRKLIVLVIAKLVLLSLIWWVAMSAYPHPDTRPAAIEHLLAPASASSSSHADHP